MIQLYLPANMAYAHEMITMANSTELEVHSISFLRFCIMILRATAMFDNFASNEESLPRQPSNYFAVRYAIPGRFSGRQVCLSNSSRLSTSQLRNIASTTVICIFSKFYLFETNAFNRQGQLNKYLISILYLIPLIESCYLRFLAL